MQGGKIQQIGTPLEIYESPANRFVAGFVGSPSISFIEARIENRRLSFGRYSVDLEEYPPELSGPVLAAIRPEHVIIEQVGKGVPASVLLVEPLGSHAVATLEHEGSRLRALVAPCSLALGSSISFSLMKDKVLLFDITSGLSLKRT